jgi:hypothetical protein
MDVHGEHVEVFAGSGAEGIDDGTRDFATLAQPQGLAADDTYLYCVDAESSAVRRTKLDGLGVVETLVGTGLFNFGDKDGSGKDAQLQHPEGLTFADGQLYVADTYNHKVKAIDTQTLAVRTLLGSGAAGNVDSRGQLNEPSGVSVADGRLYVADRNNHAVRVYDLHSHQLHTLELGELSAAQSSVPQDAAEVTLPAKTVRPGTGKVVLTVRAPDGYRLNTLAPARLDVTDADAEVVRIQAHSVTWQSREQQSSVAIEAELSPGQTTLKLAATLYYCRSEREELCFVKHVALVVPVEVAGGATNDTINLFYNLPPITTP